MGLNGALAGSDKNKEFEKKKDIIKKQLHDFMALCVKDIEKEYNVSIVTLIKYEILPNDLWGNN